MLKEFFGFVDRKRLLIEYQKEIIELNKRLRKERNKTAFGFLVLARNKLRGGSISKDEEARIRDIIEEIEEFLPLCVR